MFHPFAPGAAFWTDARHDACTTCSNDFMRELQRNDYQRDQDATALQQGSSGRCPVTGASTARTCSSCSTTRRASTTFSLKPMNCPSHHLYYGAKKHSYRELPIRFTTYDVLHRNEVIGALSGLTRVRQFQQDDCHIYLTRVADRRRGEAAHRSSSCTTTTSFGLTATLKFATRPRVRIGDDAMWDRAEGALRAALEATGLPYELKPGDGAFYGPEDRLRRGRLDRAHLAAGHDPARLQRRRSGST